MNVFGPVPSRRLDRSLGINNVPFKTCSYSCTYCQLGTTNKLSIERKAFSLPQKIFGEVNSRVELLKTRNEKIDYLTFVPDGEPTLDENIGETIRLLKKLKIKVAVITNSSLLWNSQVRNDLQDADWVSVKIDTADFDTWKKLNRPHGFLDFEKIKQGLIDFSSGFNGTLVTETMIVNDVNDGFDSLMSLIELIRDLSPKKSYILIPTRPPAVKSVSTPSIETLVAIYKLYKSFLGNVELVINSGGSDFSFIDDVEKELLCITAVHPMKKEAVNDFLIKSKSSWHIVNNLLERNLLKSVEYENSNYFIKKF